MHLGKVKFINSQRIVLTWCKLEKSFVMLVNIIRVDESICCFIVECIGVYKIEYIIGKYLLQQH